MRTAVRAIAVVIALILVADVAALFTIEKGSYPSHWDSRVAKLARFVEDTRHLRYDHPVKVEFLTEEEYKKTQTTGEGELSAQDKREIAVFEGQAHALGLMGRTTSLLDQTNAIAAGGTLAYYDDQAEKMVIRGTELTVGLRVTIVHELTHALQDQAFDLSRQFDTDGANSIFQALTEGDAVRIEDEYVNSLDDNEQQAYFDEQDQSQGDVQTALADVAPGLLALFDAPYALGEPLTTLIANERGVHKLDALFRTPPASDEGMFNAFAILDGQTPKKVSEPALRPGEKKTDSGDFGSVAWYLVLSSFIDQRVAMTAVDGWGGDAYVGYRKNNRPCIRIAFEGDTATDTAEMAAALGQWKSAFTENTATVTPTPTGVELDACEPNVVPKPRPDSADALSLPAFRLGLLTTVLDQGLPRKTSECVVRHFVSQVPLDKLNSGTDADQRLLFTLGQQIGRGCAAGQLT
jgi:hypothetical protein